MEIEWADPSEEAVFRWENRGGKYLDFALALKEHPNKWAILPVDDGDSPREKGGLQNLAGYIRNGKTKGFTKGEYEALVDDATGKPLLHVRYVGPKEHDDAKDDDAEDSDRVRDPLGHDEDDDDVVDPAEVRAWARENGVDISERGRIGREVMIGYLADRKKKILAELGEEEGVAS
jgi:hypothetical protein